MYVSMHKSVCSVCICAYVFTCMCLGMHLCFYLEEDDEEWLVDPQNKTWEVRIGKMTFGLTNLIKVLSFSYEL